MGISAIFYVCVIAFSIFLGMSCLYFIVKKNKEVFSHAERIIIFSLPISFILGRISYIILNFEEFRGNLSKIFLFWEGGFTLQVVLISFFILVFCYSEVHALKATLWCDIFIIPIIFTVAVYELSLFLLFEYVNEFFINNFSSITLYPIGFIEREFLQLPALIEGIFTFVLSVILMRIKKYDSGAILFLGISVFYAIRFISSFFYIVSNPIIFNFSHISFLIISIIFILLFLFTIKTQGGKDDKYF